MHSHPVSEQKIGSYESIDNNYYHHHIHRKLLIVKRDKVHCTWNRDRNCEGGRGVREGEGVREEGER